RPSETTVGLTPMWTVLSWTNLHRSGSSTRVSAASSTRFSVPCAAMTRWVAAQLPNRPSTGQRAGSSGAAQQRPERVVGLQGLTHRGIRVLPGVVGVAPGPVGQVEDGYADAADAGKVGDQQPGGEPVATTGIGQIPSA